MPKNSLSAQTLAIVSLWEDAVCLHAYEKSLFPPNWLRARKRLTQLAFDGHSRQPTDQPFFFYRVCVIIARHASITMGALSRTLGMPLSTTTRLVNRLSAGGYLKRSLDPTDRRIVRVALTPQGHALYRAIHSFAQQRVETMLKHLTPRERETLIALLTKALPALAETNVQSYRPKINLRANQTKNVAQD
jgi:DNA-binding MarR family transcriptional regulator